MSNGDPNGSMLIGRFESVQMTHNELRDPDGKVIMRWFDDTWFDMATGNGWYDWTIESDE